MTMHPACAECRGACCESLVLPLPPGITPQQKRYLTMRGDLNHDRTLLRVAAPCPNLQEDGACGVWTTRPTVCSDYPVAGPGCLAAIRKHRDPRQQQRIVSKMGHDGVADA